jgi:esterase/lipase superfamily enzyme
MTAPQSYYMISNRTYDSSTGQFGTNVAQGGALTFLSAPVSNPTQWTVAASQEAWVAQVQADLTACGGPATVFVHGYAVTYVDASTTAFPTYFNNLVGAGYPGVLIGFDWPSDDLGVWQPTAFQNAKAKGATTGQLSFPLLASVLLQIKGTSAVSLSMICHSMGNYVMYCGATAFAPQNGKPFLDQVLCIAAMLEYNGFNSPSSATYCADIQQAAAQVTIYFSSHDDVLPTAEKPGYDGYPELGITGPTYDSTLLSGVVGLDCSAVVNLVNAEKYEPNGNPLNIIHLSYFFIPQVLSDIQQTLADVPAGKISDRTLTSPPAGYTMNALAASPRRERAAQRAAASTG